MKHEILFEDSYPPEEFLNLLYQQYPYDIEKQMVLTLLDKETYPHPALLKFITYFAQFPKYRIASNNQEPTIDTLCARMSQLFQDNKNTLHTYVFQYDATLYIASYKIKSPYAHLCFTKIPFVTNIHFHTLPVLSMEANFIDVPIIKSRFFLFKDISIDEHAYYAISIKINDKHGIVYFPRDQIGVAIAVSFLYEVVPPTTEIDFLILYGVSTQADTLSYYFDETNQIYIGLISGKQYHHFIYVMQMITTLYNTICVDKHDLPVHACMLEVGSMHQRKGIVLIGDDHSGKSELCDGLKTYCESHQIPCTCIFENCGTLHFLDNEISATGIQIGACVSIYGLTKESIFQKLSSCAFLKSNGIITHLLFPFTSCKETNKFHKVHSLFYLNNRTKQHGCRTIEQLEEAKALFLQYHEEKRKPTHSFYIDKQHGYEQQKDDESELINQYFNIMMINDLYIAEMYIKNKQYRKEKCFLDMIQKHK